ncbi:DEAD/DEAH box helicase [Cohaesibacter celericrescens]|nr:DEAD/DEAH box helicase [Cohaesibacter celericrescens]
MPFVCSPQFEGGLIQFLQRGLLGKGKAVPVAEWNAVIKKSDNAAHRLLKMLVEEGEANGKEDGVFIPTETLLQLPDTQLNRIAVPALAGLSLTLSMHGRIDSTDSSIQLEWQDSHSRVINPNFQGPFVQVDGEWRRLSYRLFQLKEAATAFNKSAGQIFEERLPCWETMQTMLEQELGHNVRSDKYLSSLKIYQAGALTLDVKETNRGLDFSPILLPKGDAPELLEADDGPAGESEDLSQEGVNDTETVTLLPPMYAQAFESQFVQQAGQTPPAFVLGNNTFLLVDQPLRRSLDVVKRARNMPAEDRRNFLRNPRTVLAQALGEDGDSLAQAIFIETAQYSDRIQGLGLWEKPVLPWIAKKSNQWLPERFPVTIGDTTVETTAEEIETLEIDYERARGNGEETVEFQGESFGTDQIGKLLGDLRSETEAEDIDKPVEDIDQPTPEKENSVLLIQENLEANDYTAKFSLRKNKVAMSFPESWINRTVPKEHQLVGFDWICKAWRQGWPGVLLADDMGVGKTFQALAFLVWIRSNKARARIPVRELTGPILIVAPTALLNNWQKEASIHLIPDALGECCEVFGKNLKSLKRHPSDNVPPEDLLDVDQIRHADWVLTTYETLANYHQSFARVAFSVAIFDEIQKIKAPDTINSHAAKTANADFVVGMTGTPIENRIEDLWCIMDRIAPGYLKDLKTFSKTYGEENESALAELKDKLDKPQGKAPQVMLRRMKEQISKDLPSKTIAPYNVVMPVRQALVYEEVIAEAKGGAVTRKNMLEVLHKMRSISLHPDSAKEIDLYDPAQRKSWIMGSARLEKTFEILTAIENMEEKALIFLEDKAMQKALATAISEHFQLPTRPIIINGEMAGAKRQHHVDAFQSLPKGFAVLILSPKAAGIGLTITAANHVIHLSRWWNPAVEDQCNDRTYRIGQKKNVTIHVPLAVHPTHKEGSFDVKLHELLEKKRNLSKHMLAPPVSEGDAATLYGEVVS